LPAILWRESGVGILIWTDSSAVVSLITGYEYSVYKGYMTKSRLEKWIFFVPANFFELWVLNNL
jgi:hypothetical protein